MTRTEKAVVLIVFAVMVFASSLMGAMLGRATYDAASHDADVRRAVPRVHCTCSQEN